MSGISTFLWFDDRAAEAAAFYVAIFPNSRITGGQVLEDPRPGESGQVPLVTFELDGRPFTGLNGGPMFSFTPAISFVVDCADQAEVDYYWDRLTEGGEEGMCGWLVDRFGVSWQVVPRSLVEYIAGPDAAGAERARAAMMGMHRLEIEVLRSAYEGA